MTPKADSAREKPRDETDTTLRGGKQHTPAPGAAFPSEMPPTLLGRTPTDGLAKGLEPQHPFEYDLPGVRFCNWFQFKNRYADEDYSNITIEALVGPPDLNNDITVDEYRRFLANKIGTQQFPPGVADYHPPQNTAESMLHRVRLRSQSVLKRLSSIAQADSDWTRQPTTFIRPFAELIYHHDKMKAELKRVEASAAQAPSLQNDVEELQQYIVFVETVILPLKAAWDPDAPKPLTKIRHSDLTYIFRPGELLVFKKQASSHGHGLETLPSIRMHISSSLNLQTSRDREGKQSFVDIWNDFDMRVFRIDFDGRVFRPVIETFDLGWYNGEMEVRSLECYPLRFENDSARIIEKCKQYGERFRALCCGQPHWFHSGWTVSQISMDIRRQDHRWGNRPDPEPHANSEFIDSEVIIDFREAMKALRWSPDFTTLDVKGRITTSTKTDMWNILCWVDRQSTETKSAESESVVIDSDLQTMEELLDVNRQSHILNKGVAEMGDLTNLHLALLPFRVLVYSLRDRMFVGAHIDCLTEVRNSHGGFRNLRINPAHLRLIKSLVKNHFETKKLEDNKGAEMAGQDFIHGKGRGVVVLLHGVPGVGKTATAEAVSQEYSKPLFPITCGDLGTTPEVVSKNLMNIFRLASLWGCVLLLDEADVFLSRREQKGDDLMRNALVSVFLRVLEYYNGILFLTTNRPGTLDEAVKSRVHTSFFYPHLNWEQTRDIFKLNIERLRRIEGQRAEAGAERLVILETQIMRFAEDHFNTHTDHEGRWNGRQIRNAFQIAAGLAHLDGDDEREREHDAQKQLGRLQFQEVADSISSYDRFRAKVLGKHDDEIARERMERPTTFQEGGPPKDQVRTGTAGYRGTGGGGGGGRTRDTEDYSAGRRRDEHYGRYDDGHGRQSSGGGYGPRRYETEGSYRARDGRFSTEDMLPRIGGGFPSSRDGRGRGMVADRPAPEDPVGHGGAPYSPREEPAQDD